MVMLEWGLVRSPQRQSDERSHAEPPSPGQACSTLRPVRCREPAEPLTAPVSADAVPLTSDAAIVSVASR